MVELVILLFVVLAVACFGLLLPFLRLAVGIVLLAVRLLASLARSMGGGPMMHLILVIAVVIILAASYLLTFALCRAATRRDMLEARWREESAGSVGGFPPHGFASGLLAACPSDGSHDFYLSMMLDVPVPRVPMLRARLQDSRRGGAA